MPRIVVGLFAAVRTATSALVGLIHAPRFTGGPMPPSVVGLFAAVGTVMSALVGLIHGGPILVMIIGAAAAMGLAAYLATPSKKNAFKVTQSVMVLTPNS
jgi:hypothetical protein